MPKEALGLKCGVTGTPLVRTPLLRSCNHSTTQHCKQTGSAGPTAVVRFQLPERADIHFPVFSLWLVIQRTIKKITPFFKKIKWKHTLAGVVQWSEHGPVNRKVVSSIPCQGTCLGFRSGPRSGVWKRQPIDVSLTHQCFFPSLPLSLNKYNL